MRYIIIKDQTEDPSFPEIAVTLEIVPDDARDVDLVLIDDLSRDIIRALSQESIRTEPLSNGQKGSLIAIVVFISTVARSLWENKDVIIADTSGILAILTSGVIPLVKRFKQIYEKHVGQDLAAQHPIKFTLEIEGQSIQIEVDSLEKADEILTLAQRIHTNRPSKTALISQSKLKTSIPKALRRRRR